MNALILIAMGGALGALCRHGVGALSLHLLGTSFPYGTMFVNIAGSFLIGSLTIIFLSIEPVSPNLRLFLITGFLGAFTTFSAFALETITLWQRGAWAETLFYVAGSIILSLAGLLAGLAITRHVISL